VRDDRAGRGSTLIEPGAMRTPYATASPNDEFRLVTPPGSPRVGRPSKPELRRYGAPLEG